MSNLPAGTAAQAGIQSELSDSGLTERSGVTQITTVFTRCCTGIVLKPLCQRYNLKANHNKSIFELNGITAETTMSKIQLFEYVAVHQTGDIKS